ncbi:Lipase [Mycena venus]|uniref:Lipase n=1 Tax=Mycena venus TaxID=2733690 RepID=A0A8H6Y4E4_9AGAR|nr:Lipase [Mycena venus]
MGGRDVGINASRTTLSTVKPPFDRISSLSVMPLSEIAINNILEQHASQLAQFKEPDFGGEPPDSGMPGDYLENICDWVASNPRAIAAAQASQCTSTAPDIPNWNTVLFALVESAAVYLRKDDEIFEAIKAARSGNISLAVAHIKKSQETINEVAESIGCTFVQLCDFSHKGPKGTWVHSGAFCGLFVSKSSEKPFMGVTYKGTTITNFREITTDLDFSLTNPLVQEVAWDAKMHHGFNEGLFGTFNTQQGAQVAWDVMFNQLVHAYNDHSGERHMLHFTGHSLGGAYCTLTYGEFLRRQNEVAFANFKFGDMYSLAAPRVCAEPFAEQVNLHTQPKEKKYLFRIVNENDPIPTVPPRTKSQLQSIPYVHVGGAWELAGSGPRKMPNEPPQVDPQSIPELFWNAAHHQVKDYYAHWTSTPHD